jgi:hypothetical protein
MSIYSYNYILLTLDTRYYGPSEIPGKEGGLLLGEANCGEL